MIRSRTSILILALSFAVACAEDAPAPDQGAESGDVEILTADEVLTSGIILPPEERMRLAPTFGVPKESLSDFTSEVVPFGGGIESPPDVRWPAESMRPEFDEKRIYLGDPATFKKPGVANLDRVYAAIPEYREVRRKKLTVKHPRYLFLMRAASNRFLASLEAVLKKDGYDLIGGLGAIVIPEKVVPDITERVLSRLPR